MEELDRSVVVVEPEVAENLGFIARLCKNFGYSLRVVNPCFNLSEARSTAANAQDVLRDTKIFGSVSNALDGLNYVIGTKHGRGRKLSGFTGRRDSSVMIGRESSGLSNEELGMCDTVVHIDTPGYSSLNQSHATGIMLYGLRDPDSPGISSGQKEKLKSITSETVYQAILNGNPSRDEVGRIIRDLK